MKTIMGLRDPETFFLDVTSSHMEIYKMTVVEYLRADNSNARVGALRLLRDLNRDLYNMNVTPDIMERLERIEELAQKEVSMGKSLGEIHHWGRQEWMLKTSFGDWNV